MKIGEAVQILENLAQEENTKISLYVGIGRAGSPDPVVYAGTAGKMLSLDFGPPLHILLVPALLHPVEQEYLQIFAYL